MQAPPAHSSFLPNQYWNIRSGVACHLKSSCIDRQYVEYILLSSMCCGTPQTVVRDLASPRFQLRKRRPERKKKPKIEIISRAPTYLPLTVDCERDVVPFATFFVGAISRCLVRKLPDVLHLPQYTCRKNFNDSAGPPVYHLY